MANTSEHDLFNDYINSVTIRKKKDIFKEFVDDYKLKVYIMDMDANKK